MERCPFCGGSVNGCVCRYEFLGMSYDAEAPFFGLPSKIYEHGLSVEQEEVWFAHVIEAGRVPFIRYPNICVRCGTLWPQLFMVPDWEWARYVEPAMRGRILCRSCFDTIKRLVDDHAGLPDPVMVECPECAGECRFVSHQRHSAEAVPCPVCRGRGEIAEEGVQAILERRQYMAEFRKRHETLTGKKVGY